MPEATAEKEKLGFPVPTRVWLRDEKYYNVVKTKFKGATAEKFFNTDILIRWLDEHYSNKEDNSRKVWTIYVFLVWYDIYFNEDNEKVEKPVNHLDELRAIAEARQEKKLNEFGEAIMTEAEKLDKDYDAPNVGIDKSAKKAEKEQAEEKEPVKAEKPAEDNVAEEVKAEEKAEEKPEEAKAEEPEIKKEAEPEEVKTEDEPVIEEEEPQETEQAEEEPKAEKYVNISNPEDTEVYEEPKKPSTPQEELEMAIEGIEKRSKYLDEPNVISDEAIDEIVKSIKFFDDED